MSNTVQSDEFLSVQECAQKLKTSRRFIYDMLRAGRGPKHRRIGGRYRILYSSLMHWATRSPETKGH